MASITFDGQSFMIDGRRIWLVGGSIAYTRTPRNQWADRIAAAKHAGLNTITTTVHWARHEPRPGQFDFAGDADLKHFVELVGKAGLSLILRMGPYVDAGLDLGGLPPWVLTLKDVALRTANTAYLEACSRFIGAVARQVRELQATSIVPGPIVLVQNENAWTCGNDELAHAYLGELNRYLRESGFEVPVINANDLWQGVEGEIDTWTQGGEPLSNLRQMAMVRPSQPRMLSEYRVGRPVVWGGEQSPAPRVQPEGMLRELAETLAAGGQYNVEPFFGGTNFGFTAGRLPQGAAAFTVTSNDMAAPLDEAGRPSPLLAPLRRISMFASRFGRVLAHLEYRRPPVTLVPSSIVGEPEGRPGGGGGGAAVARHAVVHAVGTQGSVAFVFSSRSGQEPEEAAGLDEEPAMLLMGDGSMLPVFMGAQPVVWCLFDVRLAGRSQLDYCNLSAFALVGRVFVASGAPGSLARLSINGSPLEALVPSGDEPPEVLEHEGIVVVIAGDHQLDQIQVGDDAVYVGATGLTTAGEPIVARADSAIRRLGSDGVVQPLKVGPNVLKQAAAAPPPPPPPPPAAKGKAGKDKGKKGGKDKSARATPEPPPPEPVRLPTVHVQSAAKPGTAPALEDWRCAPQADYLDGTSARFASIAGPADLNVLGAPYGYGWYRLRLKNGAARRVKIAWPQSGDRVHLYTDGEALGILGEGPGAAHELTLPLRKGEQTVVALAENFGRFSSGLALGEPKGCYGPAYEVEPVRVGKPVLTRAEPVEPLGLQAAPVFHVHRGDVTDAQRPTWDIQHKRKTALLLRLSPGGWRGVLMLNNAPLRVVDGSGPFTVILDPEKLSRGHATVQFAVLGEAADAMADLGGALTAWECVDVPGAKAEWGFAKWEPPPADAYKPLGKRGGKGEGPHWYKASFTAPAAPGAALFFEATGLSKGQLYVNGRHLGRYFTATAEGKGVGPQAAYVVPAAFLQPGKGNELVLFDEHGAAPGKCRLMHRS